MNIIVLTIKRIKIIFYQLKIENREIKFNKNKGNIQKFKLIDIPALFNDIIDESFYLNNYIFLVN